MVIVDLDTGLEPDRSYNADKKVTVEELINCDNSAGNSKVVRRWIYEKSKAARIVVYGLL